MATLDQVLKLLIQADARGLSAGLSKATGELKNFGGIAQRTFSGISSAFAALGVTLTAGAFAVGIKKIIDGFDALNDASKRLGLSTETLSAWGYAAEQSGSSLEELQSGLKFFAKALAEARDGNKEFGVTLARYGIDPMADLEEATLQLADAFARLPDGVEKTNLALKLLGRGGLANLPLLNEGAAGLRRFQEAAERLGIVVSKETAAAADEFNDSLNTLGKGVLAVGYRMANFFLPAITQIAQAMKVAVEEGRGFSGVLSELIANSFDFAVYGAGIEGLQNKLLQLEDQLAKKRRRLRELEAEYSDRPELSNRGDLEPGFEEARREVTDLERAVAAAQEKMVQFGVSQEAAAQAAKVFRDAMGGVGDAAKETAGQIVGLQASYAKLIEEIKKGKAEAARGKLKDVDQSTVLDINRLKDQAQQALERGGTTGAGEAKRFLDQAKAINDYLLENKQISKTYYDTQAEQILRLAEIGQEVADNRTTLVLPVAPDIEGAQAAGMLAWNTAQAAINERGPLRLPVVYTDEASLPTTDDGRVILPANQQTVVSRAAGGLISGPGTGLSDSILARLSAGEFVVKAAAVKNYGLGFLDRLNSMALPRFASGGPVGTPINLHIGDRSYAMSAEPSVARQLGRILGAEVLKRGRR